MRPIPAIDKWGSWYKKYLDRDVFISLDDGVYPPSKLFNENFVNGNVDYVGRVKRFAKFTEKENMNQSFVDYCRKNGLKVPSEYRMAFSNAKAGYVSAAKYDKGQPKLDEAAWALAGEWTKQHFKSCMSGSGVIDEELVIQNMKKQTSAGYPWSLKYKSKAEMLDSPAKQVLSDYWDLIGSENEDNIVPIWTCSQKVEMRAVEKLRENNLRTFTACPFELSTATNRLCLDANNGFYNGALNTFSCVGFSKFLQGWNNVYEMLDVHKNAYELDESQYDSSLFKKALYGQRDIRWSYLHADDQTPENHLRMDAVYEAIVNSFVVMDGGELIRKQTGNPSGSSNTVVDNTMILFRLFAYAYIVLCKERGRKFSYSDFMENVSAALYGDDNTYTCSDEVNEWFTPENIGRIWSGIGVTTKTPCNSARKLSEVKFLSNGFYFCERLRLWFPVPETGRVLSSLCWGSDKMDVRWHYLRACALRLDSYWNFEVRKIISGYIDYLDKVHKEDLVGEIGGIQMQQIRNIWKSDDWIESLYCGRESSQSDFGMKILEVGLAA